MPLIDIAEPVAEGPGPALMLASAPQVAFGILDPLADQAALELRDGRENSHDQFANAVAGTIAAKIQ